MPSYQRVLAALSLIPGLVATQGARPLPFAPGERLEYSVHAGPGMNGKGTMWIEGLVNVRGVASMTFNSDIHGGLGPFKASNRSTSWFDPARLSSSRFSKTERSPFGRSAEDISIDPVERTWKAIDGRSGTVSSAEPLDELSFIYVLRTLDIPADSVLMLNRHFDADRNPTRIRSLGAGTVKVDGMTWTTREIEMRVRDAKRYHGEGVIRISLSDDACRRPVRIESSIPGAGTVTMTLVSALPAIDDCVAAPASRGESR